MRTMGEVEAKSQVKFPKKNFSIFFDKTKIFVEGKFF